MLSARRERELDRGNCGRPQSAGRLRSRTATRLNGDPQDLIRAMPAKGDRPAGPCLGGESRCNVTTRSPAGGSSCGRPRLAWPAAWSAPAPGRTGRAGAPQPGRARRRQRRGPGRRPDRGERRQFAPSGAIVVSAYPGVPSPLAPGSRCGPSDPAEVANSPGGRAVSSCSRRGRTVCGGCRSWRRRASPAPRLWRGFPCQSRDNWPCPAPSPLAATVSRHGSSEPRRASRQACSARRIRRRAG